MEGVSQMDEEISLLLLSALDNFPEFVKTDNHYRCDYCRKKITVKTFGGIMSKPNKILCKDMSCMVRYIEEWEKHKE